MTKTLKVWWGGEIVGALTIDQHGEMGFSYASDWLADPEKPALSFSLPKREEPFNRRECRPFFEGLLPEESQRFAVSRALGVSHGNEFKLLNELGGEVAGALTLWPEGEEPPAPSLATQNKPLGEAALVDLLDELPSRPFLAGREGFRLSLAGAQSKIPVILVDGEIALPAPGEATSHILKPPIERFPGTTENEAFAMRLAIKIGLDAANVEIRRAGERSFLLVARYDRIRGDDGALQRLHQEDFCQALGFTSDRKYAADGGPVFRDCFDLLRRAATRPAVEVLKLFDAAIYNLIIGNADAHAKNFSLLYRKNGAIELAPLYDLLSTAYYPELSPRLAMKIAKRHTLEELKPSDWEKFADETGLALRFIRTRAKELANAVIESIGKTNSEILESASDGDAVQEIADLISMRASSLCQRIP
ncbi:type II toxin-antitoxin system HipA family toxin [Hyphococcus flavus]|jgi:serine/threonine-protein kinase HipA|uniref:Type II toxin-antitoxin system HipA family toxin n=1 Tax=Hyphococcus flavus TaxID=1866326 RepID=A0AAF0CBV4_9PROT|nr:type II toxin-antitoxin system HipA family toxin [Hyphococcus flavus]WDI31930.1 type II toxin-antitoxin system HipA family toxin [Hyphococcus flavus]